MKISSLKRKSIPKVAVLATGMAAAVMVATVNMAPAQANPSNPGTPDCTECHTAGGSVTATPSSATVAAGDAYTVALVYTGGTGDPVGYRITRTGETAVTASDAGPADMTAPAAAGTYVYAVWMRSGDVVTNTKYGIEVTGAAPTTAAPTTAAPTTAAPAAPATTAPATTAPATVAPTVAPAVVPVGGVATGAGGAAQSNGSPLMGFGGLALLLSGAAMVTGIRRRRQV